MNACEEDRDTVESMDSHNQTLAVFAGLILLGAFVGYLVHANWAELQPIWLWLKAKLYVLAIPLVLWIAWDMLHSTHSKS